MNKEITIINKQKKATIILKLLLFEQIRIKTKNKKQKQCSDNYSVGTIWSRAYNN